MSTAPSSSAPPLLEVRNLRKVFIARGLFSKAAPVTAAEDVSFRVKQGEAVAVVGESGSGKSTVARMILRLEQADGGEILLDGEDVLSREPRRASLAYRRRVQMVFQDPFGSLNPVHDIAHHIERPLLRHKQSLNPSRDIAHHVERPLTKLRRFRAGDVRAHAIELLRTVGLEPAEEFIDRMPYELSGGQRQRVAIARALAVDPDLLVADEPTSMLDVSIRMDILTLLERLKRERKLAILLITHDLASARYLADRVLVLFHGRLVEDGPANDIVTRPIHPYTRALLSSIADTGAIAATGEVAKEEREATTTGCPFAHRCGDVRDVCWREQPASHSYGDRRVRCHLDPEEMGVDLAPEGTQIEER